MSTPPSFNQDKSVIGFPEVAKYYIICRIPVNASETQRRIDAVRVGDLDVSGGLGNASKTVCVSVNSALYGRRSNPKKRDCHALWARNDDLKRINAMASKSFGKTF